MGSPIQWPASAPAAETLVGAMFVDNEASVAVRWTTSGKTRVGDWSLLRLSSSLLVTTAQTRRTMIVITSSNRNLAPRRFLVYQLFFGRLCGFGDKTMQYRLKAGFALKAAGVTWH